MGISDVGVVHGASSVGSKWTVLSRADALELSALGRNDECWRGAAVAEEAHQGITDGTKILRRSAEGESCTSNLFDEVHDFLWVEVHEPAHVSCCRNRR